MSATRQPVTQNDIEPNLADEVLAAYDGDALAALNAILLDAKFYHDQLLLASTYLSRGASRGWTPKFERV